MIVDREIMDSLGERIAEQAAHLDAAMHGMLGDLRLFDKGGGWHVQGFRSCAAWLSWRVGWNTGTAREHVRVAHRLPELPQIADAFRRGRLSYAKVRAITRVATPDNEATLLETAELMTAAQIEKTCSKYAAVRRYAQPTKPRDDVERRYVRRSDLEDGMVRLEAVLHPDEAAEVWAALERLAAERCRARNHDQPVSAETCATEADSGTPSDRDAVSAKTPASDPDEDVSAETHAGLPARQLAPHVASHPRKPQAFDRADALVAMAHEVLRGQKRDRSPTEVLVTVPVNALRDADSTNPSEVASYADGTCVSRDTIRRLCCDAGIVVMVEDAAGNTLSVGRKTRSTPGWMKRALLKRDGTCKFPGCTTRVFLESHHTEHWADGGETALDKMVTLCTFHHRFVHEHHFTVERAERGDLHFVDREGRLVRNAPPPATPTDRSWPAIRARNDHLGIRSDELPNGWDGSPVDYPAVIDGLVRADRLV